MQYVYHGEFLFDVFCGYRVLERIAKFCIVLHTAINITIKTFAARRGIARWGAIDPSFERKIVVVTLPTI